MPLSTNYLQYTSVKQENLFFIFNVIGYLVLYVEEDLSDYITETKKQILDGCLWIKHNYQL